LVGAAAAAVDVSVPHPALSLGDVGIPDVCIRAVHVRNGAAAITPIYRPQPRTARCHRPMGGSTDPYLVRGGGAGDQRNVSSLC